MDSFNHSKPLTAYNAFRVSAYCLVLLPSRFHTVHTDNELNPILSN